MWFRGQDNSTIIDIIQSALFFFLGVNFGLLLNTVIHKTTEANLATNRKYILSSFYIIDTLLELNTKVKKF